MHPILEVVLKAAELRAVEHHLGSYACKNIIILTLRLYLRPKMRVAIGHLRFQVLRAALAARMRRVIPITANMTRTLGT